VNSIRTDDEIGLDRRSIRERQTGLVSILFETGAAVPGAYDLGGEGTRQKLHKVCAVHSECGVPPRGVRHLDRGDRLPVVAEISGIRTNARPPSFHGLAQSYSVELAHTVRCQEYPGSDLAKGRGLLINGYPDAMCDQRVRSEQSADSTPDNDDFELRLHCRYILAALLAFPSIKRICAIVSRSVNDRRRLHSLHEHHAKS
jgi:hypothetical protein